PLIANRVKSWKEKLGESTVTTIEYACPDRECQKKVNEDNKKAERLRSIRLKKNIKPRNRRKKNMGKRKRKLLRH
ncbi:hypothetical protein M1328_05215, partial [Patescibacteria group bacterium]|nr:hypothetical protein [Patescibacteria group bacterium]